MKRMNRKNKIKMTDGNGNSTVLDGKKFDLGMRLIVLLLLMDGVEGNSKKKN